MPISEIVPESVIDKMVDEIVNVTLVVQKHLAATEPAPKL